MNLPFERYMQASNADIVSGVLAVSFPDAETALDVTPGARCFWSETSPTHGITVAFSTDDFTELSQPDGSYDVVVFDPPHLADAGMASLMRQRYGTNSAKELRRIVPLGALEAMRVARLGAVIKICDHVHEGRFQNMRGWIEHELGDPFDVVHRVGHASPRGHNWTAQYSARNNGSTFLIYRHGSQIHKRRT